MFFTLCPHDFMTAQVPFPDWPLTDPAWVPVRLLDTIEPLTQKQLEQLRPWLVEQHWSVRDAALQTLFDTRHDTPYWWDFDEDENMLDFVSAPQDFLKFLTLHFVYVLGFSDDGVPYLGLAFDCPWDPEHGAGVLMLGNRCLQWGAADTASNSYLVRHIAGQSGFQALGAADSRC